MLVQNITWRMMAMTLRKKREQEKLEAERAALQGGAESLTSAAGSETSGAAEFSAPVSPASGSRPSLPTSRRSSGNSDIRPELGAAGPSNVLSGQLQGLTSIQAGAPFGPQPPARGKARARFAEMAEEEERGRRGRSSRTPESCGTV